MGDNSSATSEVHVERTVDKLIPEALLTIEDPEIVHDLHRLNGWPKSGKFDAFWDELSVYIEELTPAVDDQWHSETPHVSCYITSPSKAGH